LLQIWSVRAGWRAFLGFLGGCLGLGLRWVLIGTGVSLVQEKLVSGNCGITFFFARMNFIINPKTKLCGNNDKKN
jgi:hypothetical protein